MPTRGRTLRKNTGAARSAFSNRESQGRPSFGQSGPGMSGPGEGRREIRQDSGRMEQRRGSDDLMGMLGRQSRTEAPQRNSRREFGRTEQRRGSDDLMGLFGQSNRSETPRGGFSERSMGFDSERNRPEPPRQQDSGSILGDSLMGSLQPRSNRYTRTSSGTSLLGTLISTGLTMAPILYHMKDKDLTYHPEKWVDEDNNEHEAGYYDEEGQVHSEEEVEKEEGTYETIYQCAYCGTQMKLTWKEGEQPSCPNCGAPLSEAIPAQKEEEKSTAAQTSTATQSRTSYHEEDASGRTVSSSSSSGSGCLGMTLMLLAGLVLSLIAIF